MRTRLRDWFIVGAALAIVLGVSLQAPRDSGSVARYRPAPASDGAIRSTPGRLPPTYPRNPHPAQTAHPPEMAPLLDRVDPKSMILYYSPGFTR